jgi:hypothetical protein
MYDYKELREFLLPDHKWVYFAIRVIRSNGWIYFLMNMLPVVGTFFISDQVKTGWTIFGTLCLALASGCVSLKAYRSQSPKDAEAQAIRNGISADERKSKAEYERYNP